MRMTKTLRKEIIDNATMNAYADEAAALEQANRNLADRIYHAHITPKQEKELVGIGRDFIYFDDSIGVRYGESRWREEIRMTKERPLPIMQRNNIAWEIEGELLKEFKSLAEKSDALEKKKEDLYFKVSGLVTSFPSIKVLKEKWPEGVQFVPQYALDDKPNLPSVIADNVTSLLMQAGVKLGQQQPA